MNHPLLTPYPELNAVLAELVQSADQILADNLIGIYLQGSFAIGDFDEHSDCDFAVVVNNDLSGMPLNQIRWMHRQLFNLKTEWARHLEGSYFPAAILRDYRQTGHRLWYLDNGHNKLERSDHCNSIVVRWILREKGAVLIGPEPINLIDPIPVDILRRAILNSINGSGKMILENPEPYRNRFYQGFIVLQFCRKLHDLHAGAVGSKRSGAEWAKHNLDQAWADLIDRAWAGRPDPAFSVKQLADNADFELTLRLVECVIKAANEFEASGNLPDTGTDLPS